MPLVEQWEQIEAGLEQGWSDARLRLTLADPDGDAARAVALLGPAAPGREGSEIRFYVVRRGAGVHPGGLRRALRRLDDEGIDGSLELVGSTTAEAVPEAPPATLVDGWEAIVATLPPDWSDLYVEVELRSSDWLDRASLNMTPLNARRAAGDDSLLRFRAASRFGYGASPGMVRRCLERCDEDSIRGDVRLLRVLSDTIPVGTQGPVWQIGGRTV